MRNWNLNQNTTLSWNSYQATDILLSWCGVCRDTNYNSTWLNLQYIPRNMHTVLLCFALLWLCNRSYMNSHEVFIHIHQGCFAGTGAIVRLPQCLLSKLDGYGKISQCITTTKHSKAKTVCIFLGIYCNVYVFPSTHTHLSNVIILIGFITLRFSWKTPFIDGKSWLVHSFRRVHNTVENINKFSDMNTWYRWSAVLNYCWYCNVIKLNVLSQQHA